MNFESFGANLKAVHGLYGSLSTLGVVIADKPKTLAKVSHFIYEHFCTDDVAKRSKHLNEIIISDIIGKMVYEQVSAFRTYFLWKQPRERNGDIAVISYSTSH